MLNWKVKRKNKIIMREEEGSTEEQLIQIEKKN
jgi:hypothetical protein